MTYPRRAERRRVSVLFSDVVGSTALSLRVDPEDLMELMRRYQEVASRVVERHDGTVVQFLGDGVVAVFGYPVTHESEALRAVQAGLDLIGEIGREVPEIQIRVGVHTGLVVVARRDSSPTSPIDIVGDTTNIAARIQGLAEPGTLVISEPTYELVANEVSGDALEPQTVRGVDGTMPLFRVEEVAAWPRPLEALADTPDRIDLVGRDPELLRLRQLWSQTRTGRGAFVSIEGEAGIGKTYLVAALLNTVGRNEATRIRARCTPLTTGTPLSPFIDLAESAVLGSGDESRRRDRLRAFLSTLDIDFALAFRSLSQFLGLVPADETSPERKRRDILDVTTQIVLGLSRRRPTLMVIEDMHWSDQTTVTWLTEILHAVGTAPLLIVTTSRQPFLPGEIGIEHMMLEHLDDGAIEDLARRATRHTPLSESQYDDVVRRAEGVPLFAEQLAEWMARRGGDDSEPVPPTLHDSLVSRLDSLGEAKRTAQIAAVTASGSVFELGDLLALADLDTTEVNRSLERLEAGRIVLRLSDHRDSYVFRHALIRDAAYGSLLHAERRALHRAMAQRLESGGHNALPEVIGAHWRSAGHPDRAARHFREAAERASNRGSFADSITHLRTTLDLAEQIEEGHGSTLEAGAYLALGNAASALFGYSSAEAESAFTKASELAAAIGDGEIELRALAGLNSTFMARGDQKRALKVTAELRAKTEESGDRVLLLQVLNSYGTARLLSGRLEAARSSYQQALDLQRQGDDPDRIGVADDEATDASMLALTLTWMGRFDEADSARHRALEAGERLENPLSRSLSLGALGCADMLRIDVDGVEQLASRLRELTDQFDLPFWRSWSGFLRGWVVSQSGSTAAGRDLMKRALDESRKLEAGSMRPFFLSRLAETLIAMGTYDEAREVLTEAFQTVDESGEAAALAELHRLQGILDSDPAHLDRAAYVAREQGAKPMELRALVDRHALGRGDSQTLEDHILELANWFEEHGGWSFAEKAKANMDRDRADAED
jgi:class 3 adenylate cyclase/tetratricopeptide (TPR) repeat protein